MELKNNYQRRAGFFLDVDGNKAISQTGDFLLGYKINYPEKYSQSEKDFEEIHASWIKAIRFLPDKTIIAKYDIYTKDQFSPQKEGLNSSTYLQRKTNEFFEGRNFINHQGYVFFVKTKSSINKKASNPFKFISVDEIVEDIDGCADFEKNVKSALRQIELSNYQEFIELTADEVVQFERFFFSGFQNDYTCESIVNKNHIACNDRRIGAISITHEKKFPRIVSTQVRDDKLSSPKNEFVFYKGVFDELGLLLNCDHVVSQIIRIDNHNKLVNKIQGNIDSLQTWRKFSLENESNLKVLKEDLQAVLTDNAFKFVWGNTTVFFVGEDKADFENNKSAVESAIRNFKFSPEFMTGDGLKALYYNSFCANVKCLDESLMYLVSLDMALALSITNTNYYSDQKGIIFNDRLYNRPVRYDFWDENKKRIKSRNFGIIAPTGSGKSFTAQHILSQLIDQDILTVIIDMGDSYLKLSKLYPQDEVFVMKYDQNKSLGLNPFSLEKDERPESLDSSRIEEICNFLWVLIKQDSVPGADEQISLKKLVRSYYIDTAGEYSFQDFYDFIRNNKDKIYNLYDIKEQFFDIEQFLHAGSEFIDGGMYSHIFSSEKDNSYTFENKRLLIFELSNVQDNQILLSIFLQMISIAINKTVWKDRERKGIIFFDELAKQLEFPKVLMSVKLYIEQIRKFNGAVGIVLQSLSQLPNNEAGNSMIENIPTFIVIEGDDYSTTIDRLKLNGHDEAQLKSMQSNFTGGERRYAEVYIRRGSKFSNVYRIEVAPEVYLAFQTEGDIHTQILRLYDKYGSMEDAIEAYKKGER